MILVPDSWGSPLREFNPNHEPAGSGKGGQFAKGGAPRYTGTFRGQRQRIPIGPHSAPPIIGDPVKMTDKEFEDMVVWGGASPVAVEPATRRRVYHGEPSIPEVAGPFINPQLGPRRPGRHETMAVDTKAFNTAYNAATRGKVKGPIPPRNDVLGHMRRRGMTFAQAWRHAVKAGW
jgi:hypothetical protein